VSGIISDVVNGGQPPNENWVEDASGPQVGGASGMTNAGAVLSMAPPRSRRGLIAAGLAGALLLGIGGIALFTGDDATPASGGGAAPPAPSVHTDAPPPAPTPDTPPTPAPRTAEPEPSVAPQAFPRFPRKPRPQERVEPNPKTSPTNFRPSGL
jgi:hypothetical protein